MAVVVGTYHTRYNGKRRRFLFYIFFTSLTLTWVVLLQTLVFVIISLDSVKESTLVEDYGAGIVLGSLMLNIALGLFLTRVMTRSIHRARYKLILTARELVVPRKSELLPLTNTEMCVGKYSYSSGQGRNAYYNHVHFVWLVSGNLKWLIWADEISSKEQLKWKDFGRFTAKDWGGEALYPFNHDHSEEMELKELEKLVKDLRVQKIDETTVAVPEVLK